MASEHDRPPGVKTGAPPARCPVRAGGRVSAYRPCPVRVNNGCEELIRPSAEVLLYPAAVSTAIMSPPGEVGVADEVLDVAERDPPLRTAVMAGWRRTGWPG
ncbi:MAG: hypothetical protein WCG47_08130 [Dermatophilaceae bacterium]